MANAQNDKINKMKKVVTVKFVGVEDVVEHIQPITEKKKKKVSFAAPKSVQVDERDDDDGVGNDFLVDTGDSAATISSHLNDRKDLLGVDMFNFKVPHKQQVKLKRRASEIVNRQQQQLQQNSQQSSSSSTTTTVAPLTTTRSPTRRQSKVNFDLNDPSAMQVNSDVNHPGLLTPKRSAAAMVGSGGETPRSILKKTPSLRTGIEYDDDDCRKETDSTTTSTPSTTRRSIRLHSTTTTNNNNNVSTTNADYINTTPTKLSTPSTTKSTTPSTSKSTTPSTSKSTAPKRRSHRKTPLRLWKRFDAEGSSSSDELDTEDEIDDEDDNAESTDTDRHSNNDITCTKKTPTKTKDAKISADNDITMTPLSSTKSRTPSRRKSTTAADVNDTPRRRQSCRKQQKVDTTKDSAESYFEQHHASSKSSTATSDRTLARLGVPKMEPSEITKVLSEFQFPYEKERQSLYDGLTAGLFDKWMLLMSQNFNILLHGLGSKAKLVEMFRQRMLDDFTCVVVNGFFPSLTLKNIISSLCESLDSRESSTTLPTSIADQVDKVRRICQEQGHPDTFILINNIDGTCLRNDKVQHALSLLCTIKGIHLLATIDHINATLLWDHAKMSRLNWVWFDCTTYDSYSTETSYENSILVQQSGVLLLSSLTHVMKSLTPNARGIFLLISKYQLEAKDEHGYQGIAFPDLYMKCREAFLINSEPTLRTQLVEFKDHKMIKTKKGLDGVEYIQIALDDDTLTTFIEQQQ